MGNMLGSISDKTIDPSNTKDNTEKLMSPNAKEDPETVTGDNPQKAWAPGGKKPMGPFGPRGKNF